MTKANWYYHVKVSWQADTGAGFQPQRDGVAFDLNVAEVTDRFVLPYRRNKAIEVGGKTVPAQAETVKRSIHVVRTDSPSDDYTMQKMSEWLKHRPGKTSDDATPYEVVFSLAKTVTDEVLRTGASYVDPSLFSNARPYLGHILEQANGCYRSKYYDASIVMVRKLIESLIIEVYEHTHEESRVKDGSGNFFMLTGLIDDLLVLNVARPLNLGRAFPNAIKSLRDIGHRAAHDRLTRTRKSDMDAVKDNVRYVAEALLNACGQA